MAKSKAAPLLSGIDQFVMLAVLRLNGTAYGVSIREEIEAKTKRQISFGSIYLALERLEAEGLIRSRTGEPTPERGGRRKTYYTLTGTGQRALDGSLNELRGMTNGTTLKGALA